MQSMALLFMKNNEDSLRVYIFFCLFVLLTMKICLLTTVSTKVQEVVKKIKNKKKKGGGTGHKIKRFVVRANRRN